MGKLQIFLKLLKKVSKTQLSRIVQSRAFHGRIEIPSAIKIA